VYTFGESRNLARSLRHRDVGFWTVTHFNAVHSSCHIEATRADRRMRPPKKEWEGALLRNQQTLCNNLFPLRGGNVNDSDYARAGKHADDVFRRSYIVLIMISWCVCAR
jgi:hypothetical protein